MKSLEFLAIATVLVVLVVSVASSDKDSDSANSTNAAAPNVTTSRDSRLYLNNRVNNRYNNRVTNRRQNLPLNSRCVTQLGTSGTCLRHSECSRGDGVSSGLCSATAVCCSLTLDCGQTTSAKRVVIDSTNAVLTTDNTCTYTVRPYSKYVCQLRVDFTTNLPQPIPISGTSLLECTQGLTIGLYKFCGQNNNQHIYIPFGTGFDSYEDIVLQTGTGSSWDIVVTQIECPYADIATAFGSTLGSTFGSTLGSTLGLTLGTTLNTLDSHKKFDTSLIAPVGCLQYFTNSTGIIRSFNFNNGNGPYPPNLSYSICIKRPINADGLRLFGNVFSLDYNLMMISDPSKAIDNDCITDVMTTPGVQASNDYLLVPFATTSNGLSAFRYCGTSLQGQTLVTNMPGPFVLYFNSGQYPGVLTGPAELRAFELDYRFVR